MPQVYRSPVRYNLVTSYLSPSPYFLSENSPLPLLTPVSQLRVWVTTDHTHLCPNISVDLVSASLKIEGEQQITIVVLQFPPKESWRIRVILLSR